MEGDFLAQRYNKESIGKLAIVDWHFLFLLGICLYVLARNTELLTLAFSPQ